MFHQPEGLELQQPRATPWVPSGLRLQIKDVSSARRAGAATAQGNALGAFGLRLQIKDVSSARRAGAATAQGNALGRSLERNGIEPMTSTMPLLRSTN